MGFPGNQTKMVQLHNNITSSIMGRTRLVYASFWSHRPPRVQKTGLGWVPQLARPPRADLRNFSFFSEISVWVADREKPIFLTFESEKKCQKYFFSRFCSFPWKCDTSAPFWYIYFGRTPSRSNSLSFLKSYLLLFPSNVYNPILKTSHI